MKKILGGVLALCLVLPGSIMASDAAKSTEKLESFGDKLSYALGRDYGNAISSSIVGMEDELNLDIVIEGMRSSFEKKESLLTIEEVSAVGQEYAARMQVIQMERAQKNAAAGLAYLEENKKKNGVVVTESGLQYQVLNQGEGAIPTASDMVKVHYTGSLIDGKVFDSSIERGEPVVFPVGQIIPGWREALQLMKVGSKYRLVIPANLAYGERGNMPVIEPNSVLVFEVDLLSIEAPPAPPVELKPEEPVAKEAEKKE